MLKIFTVILFLFSVSAHAVNKVTICDSCSAPGMKSIASQDFYWNESGYAYVVDRVGRNSRKFKIDIVYIKEGPDSFPVHQATEVTPSQQDLQAFQMMYELVDMFRADLSVGGGSIQLQQIRGALELGQPSVTTLNAGPSTTATVLNPTDLTAQDFLLDSSVRNKTFDLHFAANAANYVAAVNFIAELVVIPNFNLENLKLSYKIVFPDGSFVFVVPNPKTATSDVVEGSARDANGNTIPSTADVASGRYYFDSEAAYKEMGDYLNIRFGANVEAKVCRSYIMTCTFNNNTLTCSIPTCNL